MPDPLALDGHDRCLLLEVISADRVGVDYLLAPSDITRAQKLETQGLIRLHSVRAAEYERVFGRPACEARVTAAGKRWHQPQLVEV